MPNNPFKELQGDKSVYTKLKIGFLSLIVLSVLLFSIALTVSPDFRHDIGIGNSTPVAVPHEVRPHHKPYKAHHPHQPEPAREKHRQSGHHSDHSAKLHHHAGKPITQHHSAVESLTEPPKASVEVNHEHGSTSTPEPTPEPTESSGGNVTHEESKSGGGSGVTTNPVQPPTVGKPPRVEVEIHVPPVTEAPIVEEVVGTANETVNGVTGTVEGTVNELGTPIHVEVPEICVINCR